MNRRGEGVVTALMLLSLAVMVATVVAVFVGCATEAAILCSSACYLLVWAVYLDCYMRR